MPRREGPIRFAVGVGTCAALCLSTLSGCEAARSREPGARADAGIAARHPYPPMDGREFCGRSREDAVRDVFCQEEPPEVRSLKDLQDRLGMTSFLSPDGGLQG